MPEASWAANCVAGTPADWEAPLGQLQGSKTVSPKIPRAKTLKVISPRPGPYFLAKKKNLKILLGGSFSIFVFFLKEFGARARGNF